MDVGTFFPKPEGVQKFVVKNIAPHGKRVRIFNYPIINGQTRDLLAIPGLSEENIRDSLLKGSLRLKLENGELTVIDCDIQNIQFNDIQRSFLDTIGISLGVDPPNSQVKYEDIDLVGVKNGINTIFTIPSGYFLYDDTYKALVYLNGVRQKLTNNFLISESGGPGTGYDTIIFLEAPESDDELIIDYFST